MYENEETNVIGAALNFGNLFGWAAALAKNPRAFLRGMAKSGGYTTPILFAAFWFFASTVLSFFVGLVRPATVTGPVALRLVGLILSPFVGLLFSFLMTAVIFVVWHLMGSRENFQTSFRVWAFLSPVWAVGSILGMVPYLPILVFVAFLYLLIVASEEVHGLPRDRSWLVWGILGALCVALMLVAVVIQQVSRQMPEIMKSLPPAARAVRP